LDLRHAVLLLETLRVFLCKSILKTFLLGARFVEGGGSGRGLECMAFVRIALIAQQRRAFIAEDRGLPC